MSKYSKFDNATTDNAASSGKPMDNHAMDQHHSSDRSSKSNHHDDVVDNGAAQINSLKTTAFDSSTSNGHMINNDDKAGLRKKKDLNGSNGHNSNVIVAPRSPIEDDVNSIENGNGKLDPDDDVVASPVDVWNGLGTIPTNSFRWKLRRIIEHLLFRLFGLCLILADCIILTIDLSIGEKPWAQQEAFDVVALIFVMYFVAEVSLRIYAKGAQEFFTQWYNAVDACIVLVSFLVTIIYYSLDVGGSSIKLVVFGRLIRFVMVAGRLVRLCLTEPKNLQRGARLAVGENKRRFRNEKFDLDLTYVTNKVIAMSFPSFGCMAIYRNNIKDVAKFMDSHHKPDHYKVYNLCSEKHYDTAYFHGRVERYKIDDHNVPSLEQIKSFCEDVRAWFKQNEQNVVAVHCKGGKGRTGTMICSWLLYDGQFDEAQKALDFFAERRTDRMVGSKFQGVETPSQSRFVNYWCKILRDLNGEIPAKRPMSLKYIRVNALAGIGTGDGSDFTIEVYINRDSVFIMDCSTETNCRVTYNPLADQLTVEPVNCPPLLGDIRVKFNCRSPRVPKAYENCAFYCWFNTSFVDTPKDDHVGSATRRYLVHLDRKQLDNPHKEKTWKLYREKFYLEFDMEDSTAVLGS